MQPYFFPYAGYFRLMEMSDLFVVFDCVQFNRSGWLHRNLFQKKDETIDWFTLPIVKGPRDSTKIKDLNFRDEAQEIIDKNLKKFFLHQFIEKDKNLKKIFFDVEKNVTDYLIEGMKYVNNQLGIETAIMKSSELQISELYKGQERIIRIIKKLGYNSYLNSPGGIDYYDRNIFAENGIQLNILKPYYGLKESVLETIRKEGIFKTSQNLKEECEIVN